MRGTIVTVLLLCAVAWAEEPALERQEEGSGRLGVVPFALPAYQPETSWLLGGAAALVYQPPEHSGRRESQVLLAGAASLRKQFSIILSSDVYALDDRLHLGGTLSAAKFPDRFFGVGSETRAEAEEPYTPTYYELEFSPKWRVLPSLYVGPSGRLQVAEIDGRVQGGQLDQGGVTGARGGTTVQLGVSALWDTRDSTLYPRSGALIRVQARMALPAWGSTTEFNVVRIDGRSYWTMPYAQHVVALHALVELRSGEPPFYDTGKLGSSEMMRGYFEGRFRDRQHLALQAEYRSPLFWRVGGVVFASVGNVGRSLDGAMLSNLKPAAGAGLRLAPMADVPVNLRLDVAYGSELSFYLNLGEAF
ncbi:BamA/TamA family outer membrane protein [Hyalangium versicolor]|uniref:BamA/TamA family outer membrane protein n=1 Tax=Hyalangium versicolor TaxID=2861190 RepID=UPI001CC91C8B|nr:BamA/TamA family outer membrane protein [Hyalangium versicolor]